MDRFCKPSSLPYVWGRGLTPYQVRIWSISDASRNGGFKASLHPVEAFRCSLSREEFFISRVNVARYQVSPVSISSCHKQCWDAHYVSGQPCSDQGSDELACRN